MNKNTYKKSFPKFRDWLKHWCKVHKDILHDDNTNKRFFFGNSSYIKIGDLLRKMNGADSSPCLLYDTDIHLNVINSTTVHKSHTFFICVLSEDMVEEDIIVNAKDMCEALALEFLAFFYACKAEKNPCLRGMEISNIDSTTTLLNGWECVAIRVSQPLNVGCVEENKYIVEED